MSLKNEKYKNKLESGKKRKYGKEFAEKNLLRFRKVRTTLRSWNRCLVRRWIWNATTGCLSQESLAVCRARSCC